MKTITKKIHYLIFLIPLVLFYNVAIAANKPMKPFGVAPFGILGQEELYFSFVEKTSYKLSGEAKDRETYLRNPQGQLIKKIEDDGDYVLYHYQNDQLASKQDYDEDGSIEITNYIYKQGKLIEKNKSGLKHIGDKDLYTYNNKNQLIRIEEKEDFMLDDSYQYHYDAKGMLVDAQKSNGHKTYYVYFYDNQNRLSKIEKRRVPEAAAFKAEVFIYDMKGRLARKNEYKYNILKTFTTYRYQDKKETPKKSKHIYNPKKDFSYF